MTMFDALPADSIRGYFGFESVLPLAMIIFGFNMVVDSISAQLGPNLLNFDQKLVCNRFHLQLGSPSVQH